MRLPVDPGEHVIEASAPESVTVRLVVSVGGDGDLQNVTIPPLQAETPPLPPPPLAPAPATASPSVGPAPAQEPREARVHGLSSRRTAALAAASVGVAGLAIGGFFGLRAFDKHGDPSATCRTTPCSSESISLNNQAKFSADAATVSIVSSCVALAVATVLWLSEPSLTPARNLH
jgi:hypothetical protein